MNNETYQGWPNKETWIINLWLNNEKVLYDVWLSEARLLKEGESSNGIVTSKLANRMRESLSDSANAACGNIGMFNDLLSCALSRVDWYRVAEGFME